MEYKLCIKCKLLKPTIEFYKKKSTKDKLSCYCKECGKKDTKEYNNKNRERVKMGMNWNNYGVHGWHIDHIIPCYNFNLENPEEQKKCFIKGA